MSPLPTSRFQFERTRPLRWWVYREARLAIRERILDVGSGEGRVAEEMALRTGRRVAALDMRPGTPLPAVSPLRGDAHRLPFRNGSLGVVAYHFVLMWLSNPVVALGEARRVLAPGGAVLLLSEPDFARRTEDPPMGVGALVAEAIRSGGGDPSAGAHLAGWLREAGFRPAVRETPSDPVCVADPEELRLECDFVEGLGLNASAARRAIRDTYLGGGVARVILPITYGWAWREGDETMRDEEMRG